MLPDHRKPAAWHCCLLVLTVLINSTLLTGCASLRLQRQARFQPPTLNQRADPLWEVVLAVPVRAPLLVELRTGDRIRGWFRSADQQTLVVVEGSGQIRSVPRVEILRVLLIRGSYAKRGALIGLPIGAATSVILCGEKDCDLNPLGGLLFGAMFGGIGAGVGALIGRAFPKREVIYEAPVSGAAN